MTERETSDRRTLIDAERAVLGPEACEALERWDDASMEPQRWTVEALEKLEAEVLAQVRAYELAGDVVRLAAFTRGLIRAWRACA